MLISSLISLLIFAAYVAFAVTKFKTVPASLSDTYYMFGESKLKYLFTAALVVCAFTILPPMLEVTREAVQFLAFFCPAAICFVGVAPNFKEDSEGKVHKIAAWVSAICGLLWIILGTQFWWVILVSIIVCGVLAYKTNSIESSKIWWLEMIMFLSVYLALPLAIIF